MNLLYSISVYINKTGLPQKAKGDEHVNEFERLLKTEQIAVERFVRFRIHPKTDAEDVLQEIFLTAYQKFPHLKNRDAFKAWIISIAKNKCNVSF